jgi:hypothetical protein
LNPHRTSYGPIDLAEFDVTRSGDEYSIQTVISTFLDHYIRAYGSFTEAFDIVHPQLYSNVLAHDDYLDAWKDRRSSGTISSDDFEQVRDMIRSSLHSSSEVEASDQHLNWNILNSLERIHGFCLDLIRCQDREASLKRLASYLTYMHEWQMLLNERSSIERRGKLDDGELRD